MKFKEQWRWGEKYDEDLSFSWADCHPYSLNHSGSERHHNTGHHSLCDSCNDSFAVSSSGIDDYGGEDSHGNGGTNP